MGILEVFLLIGWLTLILLDMGNSHLIGIGWADDARTVAFILQTPISSQLVQFQGCRDNRAAQITFLG